MEGFPGPGFFPFLSSDVLCVVLIPSQAPNSFGADGIPAQVQQEESVFSSNFTVTELVLVSLPERVALWAYDGIC